MYTCNGAIDHGSHFVIRQGDAHRAALERVAIALPAGEEIRRERDVAVVGEALREVERVLDEAIALMQHHHRSGGLGAWQVELCGTAVAEIDLFENLPIIADHRCRAETQELRPR